MARREVLGRRKLATGIRKRGKERRDALLRSASELLSERPLEEIAFIDIARRADVPEGSAYHFFANRYDVFMVLADQLSDQFSELLEEPVPPRARKDWPSLVRHVLERASAVYNTTPPARQLLIGSKTPPEVKHQDRMNGRKYGLVLAELFDRHFVMPILEKPQDTFFHFIELTDLIFGLSVMEHDTITLPMREEAVRVGVAYLGIYLPPSVPQRRVQHQQEN